MQLALAGLAAQHAQSTPAQFAVAWTAALVAVQNDLGSPGFAPVASNDTTRADLHRQAFVAARWGQAPAATGEQ